MKNIFKLKTREIVYLIYSFCFKMYVIDLSIFDSFYEIFDDTIFLYITTYSFYINTKKLPCELRYNRYLASP